MRYTISVKLFLKKNYPYRKNSEECMQSFPDNVSLPKLNENQTLKYEGTITVSKLLKALTSMDKENDQEKME